jgi:hypothetical protein
LAEDVRIRAAKAALLWAYDFRRTTFVAGGLPLHARLDSSADERIQHARKGTAMYRLGIAIARMIAPAFNAGRVRHCVSISKTTAKTTTKTV